MAHGNSLRRHRTLQKERAYGQRSASIPIPPLAGLNRNGWRHHLGTGGDIKSESVARSPRNPHPVSAERIRFASARASATFTFGNFPTDIRSRLLPLTTTYVFVQCATRTPKLGVMSRRDSRPSTVSPD